MASPTVQTMPQTPRKAAAKPARRRDGAPPLLAILILTVGFFLFGATEPLSTLLLSAGLIVCAFLSITLAGPRFVTLGMLAGAAAVWAAGFASATLHGLPEHALPALAAVFAGVAVWSIGYIAGRSRDILNRTWSALIWFSFAFCLFTFLTHVGASLGRRAEPLAAGFESPVAASLVFGLLAIVAASRVLHLIRQMNAESLSRSEMVGRLLRDGLGGLLLLAFSLTCLALTGSRSGLLFTGATIFGQTWWDTHALVSADHKSRVIRPIGRITPIVLVILAAWGFVDALAPNARLAGLRDAVDTMLLRLDAYAGVWLQSPFIGQGPGSIELAGAQATTLANADAMSGPGGARNVVLHWLVEYGLAGTLAGAAFILAIIIAILRGMQGRRTPRTFLRLACAASMFLLVEGLTKSSIDLPAAAWLYMLLLGLGCGVAAEGRNAATAGATRRP
jgi:hypothetical protein